MSNSELDADERKVLLSLLEDSNKAQKEINNSTGMTTTKVSRTISDLKQRKIIRKYTIDIDYSKIGYSVTAYFVFEEIKKGEKNTSNVIDFIKSIPQIIEIHKIFGKGHDFIVKIMCGSNEELMTIVEKINSHENVKNDNTFTFPIGITEKKEPGPPI